MRFLRATHPYVTTAQNWLYLCVVVDLYSGIVVDWSMSSRQDRQLVLQAVLMALWQREEPTPVILHSDRGCQFTSEEYQRFYNPRKRRQLEMIQQKDLLFTQPSAKSG